MGKITIKSPKKYKTTKKLFSRKYRKENKEKVKAYDSKPEVKKKRASRNKARRIAAKTLGKSAIKGKDVHHKDGNAKNNSPKNLTAKKRYHEGGPGKGNKNAKKKKR